MTIEWKANECFVDGVRAGRVILKDNRWRITKWLGDFALSLGWRETAADAKLALERELQT